MNIKSLVSTLLTCIDKIFISTEKWKKSLLLLEFFANYLLRCCSWCFFLIFFFWPVYMRHSSEMLSVEGSYLIIIFCLFFGIGRALCAHGLWLNAFLALCFCILCRFLLGNKNEFIFRWNFGEQIKMARESCDGDFASLWQTSRYFWLPSKHKLLNNFFFLWIFASISLLLLTSALHCVNYMLALFITIFVHLFSVTFCLACLALPSFAFVELCWIFFGDFVLLLLLFCVFCLLHAPRSSLIFFEGPNNPKNMPKLSALKKHFCFHCGREMWKLSTNSGLFFSVLLSCEDRREMVIETGTNVASWLLGWWTLDIQLWQWLIMWEKLWGFFFGRKELIVST